MGGSWRGVALLSYLAVCGLGACGTAPPPADECSTTDDCELGERCVNGDCILERDAGRMDAGSADAAIDANVDASMETDAGSDGGTDAGGGCEGGCDDGNPCTEDTCRGGACSSAPLDGVGCDDANFCNGLDVCEAGICTHAGDPCPAPTTCDDSSGACVGCRGRGDCPPDSLPPFGPCEGFEGICDEGGTRTRTVETFECVAGSCESMRRTESMPCGRDQDGVTCGEMVTHPFGACAYSDDCAESGSRTRSIDSFSCRAGTCERTSTIEADSRGCSRDTEDDPCSPCVGICRCHAESCENLRTITITSMANGNSALRHVAVCTANGNRCEVDGEGSDCLLFCPDTATVDICCSNGGHCEGSSLAPNPAYSSTRYTVESMTHDCPSSGEPIECMGTVGSNATLRCRSLPDF